MVYGKTVECNGIVNLPQKGEIVISLKVRIVLVGCDTNICIYFYQKAH